MNELKYGGIVHVNIEQSEICKVVDSHIILTLIVKIFWKKLLK